MIRIVPLAVIFALYATSAAANDTTAELKTGGLVYLRSDAVSMEEEKLYISPKEVRVDYVFHNTSDAAVETYVAFPMPDIPGGPEQNIDAGDVESDNFLGFSVTQDGADLKPSLQQRAYVGDLDMTDAVKTAGMPMNPQSQASREALRKLPPETIEDWLTRGLVIPDIYDDGSGMKKEYTPMWTLKSAYYWKTSFPTGKNISVSHRYRPSVGGTVAILFLESDGKLREGTYQDYQKKFCIDDAFVKTARRALGNMNEGVSPYYENWISYVLTTGANWVGPIKKFTLVVDKGEADNFVSFCGQDVRKTGPTTFEMTATDFYPEKDLDILLLVPSQAP